MQRHRGRCAVAPGPGPRIVALLAAVLVVLSLGLVASPAGALGSQRTATTARATTHHHATTAPTHLRAVQGPHQHDAPVAGLDTAAAPTDEPSLPVGSVPHVVVAAPVTVRLEVGREHDGRAPPAV